jgi:threonine dehydrogenase-like Zn-dependent dehydrogenase
MKALTWQGIHDVEVKDVEDPRIEHDTDAVIRITSTAICGSDLHLYEVFGPFLDKDDVLGHENMGVVEEVGSAVTKLKVGDRVVVPFVIACHDCFMCDRGLFTQCETTQVKSQGSGAALYGFSELYGSIPGGQAERLRMPLADANAIVVNGELPDERYLFLSDILPTAWQGVQYANVPEGGTLGVMGLGPVGQFAARIGKHLGYRVIAVDPVPERREMAKRHGIETLDLTDDVADRLRALTDGRGPDAMVEAVGMEAHGSPAASFAQKAAGLLPDGIAKKVMDTASVDRLAALHTAFDAVRRGGTVSISGVYGRPDADEVAVRQADRDPHGPVQRPALDRGPAAPRRGPGRPARRHGPRHAHGAPQRGRAHVRDLPEEGGRLHQGGAQAVASRLA